MRGTKHPNGYKLMPRARRMLHPTKMTTIMVVTAPTQPRIFHAQKSKVQHIHIDNTLQGHVSHYFFVALVDRFFLLFGSADLPGFP
jgi:hypothetical protein